MVAKWKETIIISINLVTKTISNVFYILDIDQNMSSVGQLIEKGMNVTFKYQFWHIFLCYRIKDIKKYDEI